MSALKTQPYLAYGVDMVGLRWHRYIAQHISKMRLGVGISSSLFVTPTGFPVLAVKDTRDSFVMGEIFYLNDKGLKSLAKLYREEFPEAKLHAVRAREVDVFAMAGFRGSDAVEKKVLTYGLLYNEASYYVSQGKLRYSIHNSYHNEISSPSPAHRKSYPNKTFVPAQFKEVEDE